LAAEKGACAIGRSTFPMADNLSDIQGKSPSSTRRRPMNAHAIPNTAEATSAEGVAAEELKQFIERIERLEEEKAGISSDIKDVYAELKGRGYDAAAIRKIISMRKKDHAERQEEEAILELYMQALGMV
jgi:uncharacterized protein (UPF0335 family)